MASGEPVNTHTEEETIALKKKRANRRVSFADVEITSVHIFNRDEDFSDDHPTTPSASHSQQEVLGFFRDLADSDDSSPNEDPERNSFLRPIGSPSPGSSTVGSASAAFDDDEDNFFGPVSANFIRPGRLSDSAASDDITMDSTAFSMHFRSLARSDSGVGGDINTPTSTLAHRLLASEDNTTPSQPDSSTGLMVLTKAKNLPINKVRSGGKDSNDMSIVGENPRSYDYGRLSPRLDALLAEGSKDLNAVTVDSKSFKGSEDVHVSTEARTPPPLQIREANGGSRTTPFHQITHDYHIQTSKQLIKANEEFTEDAVEMSMPMPQFIDDNGGTPSNENVTILQLDVSSQPKPAYQPSSEGTVKGNATQVRKHISEINQKSGLQYEPLLEEPISLSSSKQWQSFMNTPNSANYTGIVTPSSELPVSFSGVERIRHDESASSIRKSISKLRIPEPSPRSSSLKEGIDKLRHRLLNYCPVSSLSNSVLAGSSTHLQERYKGTPIAQLEEHLRAADVKKGEDENLINIDGDGMKTPKRMDNFCPNGQTLDIAKAGESYHHMSMGLLSKDKLKKPMAAVTSPSQLHQSQGELVQDFFMTGNPVKSFDQNFLVSSQQGNLSPQLHQLDEYKKHGVFGLGKNGDSVERDSHSPLVAAKQDSLLSERRAEFVSPFSNTSHVKEFTQAERVVVNNHPNLQNESETFTNVQSHLWDRDVMNSLFESADKSLQDGVDRHESDFQKRSKNEPSPEKSSNREKPTESPTSKVLTPTLCGQDPSIASHDEMMPPYIRKVVPSPRSDSIIQDNNCHRQVHISEGHFPARDVDNYSGRKRRNTQRDGDHIDKLPRIQRSPVDHVTGSGNLESMLENADGNNKGEKFGYGRNAQRDGDHIDKLPRIQRSPVDHVTGSCNLESMLENADGNNKEGEKFGYDITWMSWVDILGKFSGATERLLSDLVDKLNLKRLCMLDDMVVHLLKVKRYEMLCADIQTQGKADHLHSIQHKRVTETRSLLYNIIYKKAQLQLMSVKCKILLKRQQLFRSGIQECQMVKLKIGHQSEYGTGDAPIPSSLHQSSLVNFEGIHEVPTNAHVLHQVLCDKVTTMRLESEALNRKLESLSKYFHSNSKMKGKPSCADTIALVHDQLKNRMCCRFIRQDFQLWQIDDFESTKGCYNILLNYRGYISQRFTVNGGPVSSIIISNKVNDTKILKNFPNMDACTAFAFVLNGETTKKYVSSRCLAQEIQVSSSLLCNVLDVVEEVQLTQIEIRNLIQTSFRSPSANQLDLQLCFIDFYSGSKLSLTLDMTCLNRGVYPSEIFPREIHAPIAGPEKSRPQSLVAEIRAATENLRAGYSRIMRLCSCVSRVLQASSR